MKREELTKLYEKHWSTYVDNIRTQEQVEAANPFLIVPPEDYEKKKHRVMICGQETMCWGEKEFGDNNDMATIEALMDLYDSFVNNGGYNSPYWQFVKYLKRTCEDTSFVMNNIVKIGKRFDKGCDDSINALALKYFPVFKEELNILKPDLIVFLTGNKYYGRMRLALGDFTSDPLNGSDCVQKLVFSDSDIPTALCCYHPNYLRFSRKEKNVRMVIADYINAMR